jgi:hypothetical protein
VWWRRFAGLGGRDGSLRWGAGATTSPSTPGRLVPPVGPEPAQAQRRPSPNHDERAQEALCAGRKRAEEVALRGRVVRRVEHGSPLDLGLVHVSGEPRGDLCEPDQAGRARRSRCSIMEKAR